jgi:hypothetical protein
MTTRDDMVREFFLGDGLALISELRRHGDELSLGKMHPVLHKLEQATRRPKAMTPGRRREKTR